MRPALLHIAGVILVLGMLLLVSCSRDNEIVSTGSGGFGENTRCHRFICGNDTYTGSGDLSGRSWASIQMTFSKNYFNNTHGWNQTQTWSNGSVTYLWMPWYVSSDSMSEANLKDTYTQSAYGVNANWTVNTHVSDEGSELAMAAIMNWSNTTVRYFINYLDVCADKTAAHISQGPWLTSWVCSQRDGVLTKNDENSASDATARYAIALFMACKNTQLDTATRNLACARAVNISRASVNEEWVTSCRDSIVNTSTQLCNWRLAGAGQAWGAGALTQVGEQMFFGYHEPDIMANLAAYAYTHDTTYSSAARNEIHQFLYVVGFRNNGNTSADFNYTTGGANYYLDCATTPCVPRTQSGSSTMDDADAPRLWETCNNYEYANLTYTAFGEALPWEVVALGKYCDAWTARMGPSGSVSDGGTTFATPTSACYRFKNNGTCDSTGIIGLNTYRPAGWVSNLVARTNNVTYYNAFVTGSLSTYSTTNDVFGSDTGFGSYSPVRYLRSIRAVTGYYDFLFTNSSYDYQAYANGTGYLGAFSGGGVAANISITNTSLNTTSVYTGGAIRFSTNANTTVGDVVAVKVQVLYANGTRINYSLTRLTE
jgi:hypothetical protein